MMKNIKFKKVFAIMAIFALAFMSMPLTSIQASQPAVIVSVLSTRTVKEGGSVSFTLKYTGDIKAISLKEGDIGLDGFTATKTITVSGNDRIVTLSNIKSSNSVYTGKYVHIAGGTAISNTWEMANLTNTQVFTIVPKDTVAPTLTISAPTPNKVYAGESVTYTLTYKDDVAIKTISLKEGDIGLDGFTATKKIVINSDNTATVTLSNIQGTVGGNKILRVAGGTAIDDDYNMANAVTAPEFKIVEKPADPTPVDPKPVDPKPTDPTPEKPADWKDNPNTGIDF